jgi:hypothetical protein
MRDPHGRFRGRGVVAAAMALLIAGAGALLVDWGLGSEPAAPPPDRSTAEPPSTPDAGKISKQVTELREAVEASRSPLGLEQIVAAGDAAAKAYAAGSLGSDENAALVDRRFEVRIPFGCEGPAAANAGDPLRWISDAKRQTLRLSARPEIWTDAAFATAVTDAADIEAVEGFWIPRPWLASEACPPRSVRSPASEEALPAPRPTLGLAQFFRPGESRLSQRGGRPYEVVKRATPEAVESLQGFRLVLRGRVAALPDGQPVRCYSESSDLRPICLVSVELDYVAFEKPVTGEIIAEWRN